MMSQPFYLHDLPDSRNVLIIKKFSNWQDQFQLGYGGRYLEI